MKRVGAVLLAAGASRRFGDENKLLAHLNGRPILSHVISSLAPLKFHRKAAVVQSDVSDVARLCAEAGFKVIVNDRAHSELGASIAAGVRQMHDVDAVMMVLGDMPFVKADTMQALLKACDASSNDAIIAPVCDSRRGHPVIFGREHFDALRAQDRSKGAKSVIDANAALLKSVFVDDPGVVQDIDSVGDLEKFARTTL